MNLTLFILGLLCIGTIVLYTPTGIEAFVLVNYPGNKLKPLSFRHTLHKTAAKKISDSAESKVPSTQMKGEIIPDKFEWVPVLKITEMAPGDMIPFVQDGQQLLMVVEKESGSIFCTAQASPFLSYPLSQGVTDGNTIICPQSKTKFDLETGKIIDQWCPFPPFLGPLILGKLVPPRDLAVFPTRAKNGNIEVYINRNFQSQFESQYWQGLLDAQGKATGDYY